MVTHRVNFNTFMVIYNLFCVLPKKFDTVYNLSIYTCTHTNKTMNIKTEVEHKILWMNTCMYSY